MKARLVKRNNQTILLLCTGRIKMLSDCDACNFLLNHDACDYDTANGNWDYSISMEEYGGDTIAYVNDDVQLVVVDAALFREYIQFNTPVFLSVPEYAELQGKRTSIVRRLCRQGRLNGAIQIGTKWLIPSNCPYPADKRCRD